MWALRQMLLDFLADVDLVISILEVQLEKVYTFLKSRKNLIDYR